MNKNNKNKSCEQHITHEENKMWKCKRPTINLQTLIHSDDSSDSKESLPGRQHCNERENTLKLFKYTGNSETKRSPSPQRYYGALFPFSNCFSYLSTAMRFYLRVQLLPTMPKRSKTTSPWYTKTTLFKKSSFSSEFAIFSSPVSLIRIKLTMHLFFFMQISVIVASYAGVLCLVTSRNPPHFHVTQSSPSGEDCVTWRAKDRLRRSVVWR